MFRNRLEALDYNQKNDVHDLFLKCLQSSACSSLEEYPEEFEISFAGSGSLNIEQTLMHGCVSTEFKCWRRIKNIITHAYLSFFVTEIHITIKKKRPD